MIRSILSIAILIPLLVSGQNKYTLRKAFVSYKYDSTRYLSAVAYYNYWGKITYEKIYGKHFEDGEVDYSDTSKWFSITNYLYQRDTFLEKETRVTSLGDTTVEKYYYDKNNILTKSIQKTFSNQFTVCGCMPDEHKSWGKPTIHSYTYNKKNLLVSLSTKRNDCYSEDGIEVNNTFIKHYQYDSLNRILSEKTHLNEQIIDSFEYYYFKDGVSFFGKNDNYTTRNYTTLFLYDSAGNTIIEENYSDNFISKTFFEYMPEKRIFKDCWYDERGLNRTSFYIYE